MKKIITYILIALFCLLPFVCCFTFTYFNLKNNNDDVCEKLDNIHLLDDDIKELLISYNKDKTFISINIENIVLNKLFGCRYYLSFDVYEFTEYHIYCYSVEYEFHNVYLNKSLKNFERLIK